ncbi:SLAP domain-containing protein [Clostridium lundense]|uniref:SLAP domain-containing protein n=1 Tax=Clostridium lundense TaxID=319475 RepID=UPI0006841A0F|nr:SLAP domain-containing protein [Clostridium lundense]
MEKNRDSSIEAAKKDALNIELSINNDVVDRISDVQKSYLEEEMSETIPEIKEGEIGVFGVYAFSDDDKLEVKIYIVNGLEKPINFEEVPLYIINSKGEQLAYQVFDFSKIGDIPPRSARPWKVYFDKENLFVKEIPQDDWTVVVNNNAKAVRYSKIELEKIPDGMDEEEISTFNEFMGSLPKLEYGQVSVSLFTVTQYKNNNLLMTLLVRNATNESIRLEKIPVTIKTADGKTVLSGIFDLEDFEIGSHKARILSLVFEKELLLEEEIDLTTCSVTFNRE